MYAFATAADPWNGRSVLRRRRVDPGCGEQRQWSWEVQRQVAGTAAYRRAVREGQLARQRQWRIGVQPNPCKWGNPNWGLADPARAGSPGRPLPRRRDLSPARRPLMLRSRGPRSGSSSSSRRVVRCACRWRRFKTNCGSLIVWRGLAQESSRNNLCCRTQRETIRLARNQRRCRRRKLPRRRRSPRRGQDNPANNPLKP